MRELFDAIQAGDAARVGALIDADPSLVDATDPSGLPAFAVAWYRRKMDIAGLLEARGATLDIFAASMAGRSSRIADLLSGNRSLVSAYSADGWTPLHLAVFFGHGETARALLSRGADVNARSTNPMRNTPLHAAAAGRSAETVKMLLDYGASVDAQQRGGWTALHAAAQNGDARTLETLIAGGADVRIRADNQQSALDLALTHGHQQIVELLELHGATL